MAPTKSKVSSTFFDLKAEIAKQEEEFAKSKAAGKSNLIVGGIKRPDKKPTVWARHNKGVNSRASRDIELEEISKPTLDTARAALERKAKIYDKLRKGKTGGLSDKQYDALLVDFDQRMDGDAYESDSDDVDESLVVPQAPLDEQDDPMVEYEDEFGRIRTARRSEVPRHLASEDKGEAELDEDEDLIIRNPVNHFPVYEPTADRVAQIREEYSEANNPLNVHYDATHEVRAKGAGFYAFSGDEETRRRQMEELKAARVETEETRQEMGAVDLKPGEAEGMRDETQLKSRAMEKRKRDIEERRRLLDAKRRKLKGPGDHPSMSSKEAEASEHPTISPPGVASLSTALPNVPPPSTTPPSPKLSNAMPPDPFAALEAQAIVKDKPTKKGRRKRVRPDEQELKAHEKVAPDLESAEAFLSQLEQEMLKRAPGN